jgi:peroxiredoxin
MKTVLLGFYLLLQALPSGAQSWSTERLSFATISRINLKNTSGKEISVVPAEKALHLFIMLSPECPLCKNYSLVLNKLHRKYESSVQLLGIVPGNTYSADTLQRFAQDYGIGFPLLIDTEMRLSRHLKATVTPEVILADNNGDIIYRGAIDDWMVELGKKKPAPQQHYLADAINQYLNGQPVSIRSTVAKGCLINEF